MIKASFVNPLLLGATLLWPVLSATSQTQTGNLIKNGNFAGRKQGWRLRAHAGQALNAQWVPGPTKGSTALRMTAKPTGKLKNYHLDASQMLTRPLKPNETVTVRFWARSPQSTKISVMVQQPEKPFRSALYREFKLSSKWQEFKASGRNPQGFKQGDVMVQFFLSFAPGQVDLANVRVTKAAVSPSAARTSAVNQNVEGRDRDIERGVLCS